MVFLKLEKLGVLESGILFIAAVIIMIIILFLLLFLMICRTSRGPRKLALAHLSDFGPLDLPSCSWGLSYIVFTLSSAHSPFHQRSVAFAVSGGLHHPISTKLDSEVTSLRCPSLTSAPKVLDLPPLPFPASSEVLSSMRITFFKKPFIY